MKIICPNPNDFSKEIISYFKKNFSCYFKKMSQKHLDQNLKFYDVVLTRFNHKVNYLKNNKLSYILSPTTGVDHIDKKYFNSKTKIISLRSEYKFLKKINASAEFTIYLILKALKTFKLYNNNFYNEIYGKSVGVIGYGRIGKKICPILKKMGAKVFINDLKKEIVPKENFKKIENLMKSSQILCFCIPLNKANKGTFNKKKIKLIKNNTIIVNTSRGDIFDEKVLFTRIKNSKIYYATDVLGDFLIKKFYEKKIKKKIIYTRHVAGLTNESVKMTDNFVLKKFLIDIKSSNFNI